LKKKNNKIKEQRDKALEEHDERAGQISKWVKDRGGARIYVKPYAKNATKESVEELIEAIQNELGTSVHRDSSILLNVARYLLTYDFATIDEAGYETPGFSLALSEVDTALRHLKRNPKNAMRYLAYRYKLKMWANNYMLFDFVPVLHLEAAFNCNLICTMCYQSDPVLQEKIKAAPVKSMQWDLFTKVIDEAAERGCNAVVFAGRGEPTLNPRFSDMIAYCHKKEILDIKFNTNVMTLDEKKVREWLSLDAFLTIVFSVDAGDKEVFEKIRIGSDFEKILNNIKMFNRIRHDEFPNSPVRTRVNMVLFSEDQNEQQARDLWEPLVDEFSARNANYEQAGSIYQPDKDGSTKNVCPGKVCRVLFTRMYVWSDGSVNPCESDYLSKLKIGDANTDSLYDLWNGPVMMKYRMLHSSGKKNNMKYVQSCISSFLNSWRRGKRPGW